MSEVILDVVHVSSKGTSYRMTLPRKIVEMMGVKDDDLIAFYSENGKICIKVLR
ncbi:MAG: AbrB/MazE/SpoVT family DNA-binding domain-containing protein [Candidatus Thermoplasmatota archaeon]|nr:AbrB/MazE/SpoVT family DNA-binding domain-containing protein [Candidatus Thermoplasmatota archaeon]